MTCRANYTKILGYLILPYMAKFYYSFKKWDIYSFMTKNIAIAVGYL